jgi:MFS family permease
MNASDLTKSTVYQDQWTLLLMLFTIHVLTAVGMFSISPLIPLIKKELGLNHTQVGMLSGSFFLGVALNSAIAGWAIDLLGVRKMILLGTILLSGSLLAAACFPLYVPMLVLFVIAGIGYCVVTPSTNKAVMCWFNERIRATVMGFKQTGINAGGFLAGIILPPLALAINWRWALLTAGFIVAGTLFFILFLFKKKTSGALFVPIGQWFEKFKMVIYERNILLLSVEAFFRVGTQMAFFTYLVLFLQKALNLNLIISSFLFALAQGSGAVGRIVWGVISDRIFGGRRKSVYLFIGLIATIIFFLIGLLDPKTPLWIVFVIVICLGFTAAGHQGVGLTMLGESVGTELTGTATGLGQSLSFLGAVTTSPGFGLIVDSYGTFSYAWASLASLSFLCCVILCFVREKTK